MNYESVATQSTRLQPSIVCSVAPAKALIFSCYHGTEIYDPQVRDIKAWVSQFWELAK